MVFSTAIARKRWRLWVVLLFSSPAMLIMIVPGIITWDLSHSYDPLAELILALAIVVVSVLFLWATWFCLTIPLACPPVLTLSCIPVVIVLQLATAPFQTSSKSLKFIFDCAEATGQLLYIGLLLLTIGAALGALPCGFYAHAKSARRAGVVIIGLMIVWITCSWLVPQKKLGTPDFILSALQWTFPQRNAAQLRMNFEDEFDAWQDRGRQSSLYGGFLVIGTVMRWRAGPVDLALVARRKRSKQRQICQNCGYSRKGLEPYAVCPECGQGPRAFASK